jgi:hypothetical protein
MEGVQTLHLPAREIKRRAIHHRRILQVMVPRFSGQSFFSTPNNLHQFSARFSNLQRIFSAQFSDNDKSFLSSAWQYEQRRCLKTTDTNMNTCFRLANRLASAAERYRLRISDSIFLAPNNFNFRCTFMVSSLSTVDWH